MSATRLEKGPSLMPPALEFEFRMRVQIGAPLDQGTWDGQRRRVMPIVGGTFEGPRFSGTILPGGADWQSVRVTDGVARIDARYTLRHDDGTVITMVDRGVRRGPLEVMARLAAGEVVEPSLYYFRTTPRFEVQDGPHQWLAGHVLLKDNFDTMDMPTTGGALALSRIVPKADAFQVKKLRQAGVVILGKVNLHELALGLTTISSLGGQTLDPYDLTRAPGGSSGGSGVAPPTSRRSPWGPTRAVPFEYPALTTASWA